MHTPRLGGQEVEDQAISETHSYKLNNRGKCELTKKTVPNFGFLCSNLFLTRGDSHRSLGLAGWGRRRGIPELSGRGPRGILIYRHLGPGPVKTGPPRGAWRHTRSHSDFHSLDSETTSSNNRILFSKQQQKKCTNLCLQPLRRTHRVTHKHTHKNCWAKGFEVGEPLPLAKPAFLKCKF